MFEGAASNNPCVAISKTLVATLTSRVLELEEQNRRLREELEHERALSEAEIDDGK